MDFELTEDEKLFKAAVDKIVKRELKPLLASYPADKPLPKDACMMVIQMFKPLGLLGARVPEKDGGSGIGSFKLGIFSGAVPLDVHGLVSLVDSVSLDIATGGDDELKERILPHLLAGEKICANAVSEPNSGSDPSAVETTARLEGDEYVINGKKLWITNGCACDVMLVTAVVGKDKAGKKIITPFLVEKEVSPFEARPVPVIGLSQDLAEITLEDCRVPKGNMLSQFRSHALRMHSIHWLSERPLHGLGAVRIAQEALEASIKYSQQRKQFGKLIGGYQLIQGMIAEMATLVDASRLLCYRALRMIDKGVWCPKESSMAKYFATEAANKVTSMALQIHGAIGLTRDYGLERLVRDVKLYPIEAGTTQIMQLIIGRELLGIRAFRQ